MKYSGAGILVISGKYIILGKDYTNTWADFGGRRNIDEDNPIETAIREFKEETLNTIRIGKIIGKIKINEYYCFIMNVNVSKDIHEIFKKKRMKEKSEIQKIYRFPINKNKKDFSIMLDEFGREHQIRKRTQLVLEKIIKNENN